MRPTDCAFSPEGCGKLAGGTTPGKNPGSKSAPAGGGGASQEGDGSPAFHRPSGAALAFPGFPGVVPPAKFPQPSGLKAQAIGLLPLLLESLVLPSSAPGQFMESLLLLTRMHWDHEAGRLLSPSLSSARSGGEGARRAGEEVPRFVESGKEGGWNERTEIRHGGRR